MAIKLASPLFILREYCQADLPGVLRRLRALGFDGVEFLGLFGHDAADLRALMDDIGLEAVGDHIGINELLADPDKHLDAYRTLGCKFLSVVGIPEEAMPGTDGWAETQAKYARAAALARARGITLLYHNHDNELLHRVNGAHQLEAIMDGIPADHLKLEPDLGWIRIGGGDPLHFITKYRDRCPILHWKDFYASDCSLLGDVHDFLPNKGPADRGSFAFRPTGYGIMNYPALLQPSLQCAPQWIVLDHDLAYENDPFNELKLSLDFARALLAL